MNKLFLVVPIFCCVLLACSSRPTDIPRDAKQHWDFINGYSWTWKRDLEYGCVGWMAKESWAVLILSDVTPCKGEIGEGILNVDGKGLKYSSTNDFLVLVVFLHHFFNVCKVIWLTNDDAIKSSVFVSF